jgi:hypothetical protein
VQNALCELPSDTALGRTGWRRARGEVWDICQSCGGVRHQLLQHHDQRGQGGTRHELSPLFRDIARRWLQVPERRKRRLFDE